MKYFKIYIKPKIMFHFIHLNELPNFKDIFQAITCIVCLPNAYLDMNKVFEPGKANGCYKFWSIFCLVKGGNINLPKDSDHLRLKRWRILCSIMNKFYIYIYKAIKFISCGEISLKSKEGPITLDEFKPCKSIRCNFVLHY